MPQGAFRDVFTDANPDRFLDMPCLIDSDEFEESRKVL